MLERHDHGPIRELRLARPPANALNPELLDALLAALRDEEPPAAFVLSGAPGMFSGGLDVPALLRLDQDQLHAAMERFFAVMEALAGSPVPVAAALTGHSPAGGAVLALFCDWRVMASGRWVIGLNEIEVGIPMPRTIVAALSRLVGPRRAEELIVRGRLVDPEEALDLGIVDQVVPSEEVVETAITWSTEVVARPRRTLEMTRRSTRGDLIEAVARHWRSDLDTMVEEWNQPEAQEALQALVEKLAQKR
jgi:enoyl-CoA hydratase/carnithine racemase